MEQGKRARQWGACITLTVSPVTPVVCNLFLVSLAPRTPLHLCPRLMDHPALAQARVWRRLGYGPFLSGPDLLKWPRSLRRSAGPWAGRRGARGSFLLAIGRGYPSGPQFWSLCAVQGTVSPGCLGCCALSLPGHGANISFPCNLFFVLILYTV